MAKKLLRITSTKIKEEVSFLIEKEVNLVFINDSVLHGVFLKLENDVVHLRNLRNKKSSHPISDISEIVIDLL